ncbi:hypothetical protein K0M31_006590 [Melipona bicolor]|uniref:Uncharacterized protein n=1 Tax=Melipona bicolor TaxID=60889 RepID=A0AA40KKW4_9HYME|nr:hypothetical protein K0M31_006590 [Melipona bicolor]
MVGKKWFEKLMVAATFQESSTSAKNQNRKLQEVAEDRNEKKRRSGTQLTLELLYKYLCTTPEIKIRQFIQYIPDKTFLHLNKIFWRWSPREKKPSRASKNVQLTDTKRLAGRIEEIRISPATLPEQFCYAKTPDEKALE